MFFKKSDNKKLKGICSLCGEPLFSRGKYHEECLKKRDAGRAEIIELIKKSANTGRDLDVIGSQIYSIVAESYIKAIDLRNLLIWGVDEAVYNALDDGIITEEEEQAVARFMKYFDISWVEANEKGSYWKLAKAAILRDITDGNVPDVFHDEEGLLPFNFQKNEKLIWAFYNPLVDYYQRRSSTEYVGGHQGVSIKVMKGVYYRIGGFRGHPVITANLINVGKGIMAVTTKHIYFAGKIESFRIRFEKIVSFVPYDDGIGIQTDKARAKPQIFVTGDGWFTYNLVTNLAQLHL